MKHSIKKRIFALMTIIVSLIIVQSCYKDPFDFNKLTKTSFTPDLAAPLVHSRLTLLKLLDVGKLSYQTDASNFLTLIYSDTVFSQKGSELYSMLPQVFDTNFFLHVPPLQNGDSSTTNYLFKHNVVTQNMETIDSVVFLEGFYRFKLAANLNQAALISISIPDLKKDGQVFKKTIPYTYSGGNHEVEVIEYDLAGYQYTFNKTSPTLTQLSEELEIKVYITNDTMLKSSYFFSVRKEIYGAKFYKLFGYLGQKNYDLGEDEFKLNIFDNNAAGAIFLEDPRLNLRFFNSFGMPVLINMPTFEVSRDGLTLPINSPLLNNLLINAPTLSQIGEFEQTNYSFDKSNSNIKDAFNLMPKKLKYHIKGQSNPSGVINPNFALNTSIFYTVIEAELPLFGRSLNYTLIDTADFKFDDDPNIEYIEMHIFASSFLPAEAKLQILFADSNDVVIDSLFSAPSFIIKAATPGPPPAYRVSSAVRNTVSIKLDRAKLNKLSATKKLFITAMVSTANAGASSLKLYADYAIDVNVGARAKYKVEF